MAEAVALQFTQVNMTRGFNISRKTELAERQANERMGTSERANART